MAALEAELGVAETELASAQAALERVQAEATRAPQGLPAITQQDMEADAALRELVAQAGMPIQELL